MPDRGRREEGGAVRHRHRRREARPPDGPLPPRLPGRIRPYAKVSSIGAVREDAGLPRPANRRINGPAAGVGPGRIDEADAGRILTGVYGGPEAADRDKAEDNAEDNALRKELDAVKNGQAEGVPDETRRLGPGAAAAGRVPDGLRAYSIKRGRPGGPPTPWRAGHVAQVTCLRAPSV
ncbi:hypothetical protein [Streptomyces enissocaesilis]|uniref:Uncharacterized protein n=1 Tax=Streptomyces enissocaesilis TaxID=332589 RepID=A0ABP6JCF5_9ACTN